MNHMKHMEKNQRFKIQVVKKNIKRIQSTPQRLPANIDKAKGDYTSFSKIKYDEKYRQMHSINPQQIKPLSSKHVKSKSQFQYQIPINNFLIDNQYGVDSLYFSSLVQKHIYKDYRIPEEPQLQQSEPAKIKQKKSSQIKNNAKNKKYFLNNPFESMNVVKCQSITLISLNKKNHKDSIKPMSYQKTSSMSISRKKIKIPNINNTKIMSFNLHTDPDSLYMKKLKLYMDFCFKVNFSNRIYIQPQFKQNQQFYKKYRAYVGWGNNNEVIKNCLKKRFWFQIVDKFQQSDIRFYWTPYPIKGLYEKQSDRQVRYEQCPLVNIKKVIKTDQQVINLNQKILTGKDSFKVQNFIVPDGYIPPFSEYKSPKILSNHLSGGSCISEKKKLFRSLFKYYNQKLKQNPFDVIPVTYNVINAEDSEYKRFMRDNQNKTDKIWIIKPGENSNRGDGICLAKTSDVLMKINQGQRQTYVIQSYIEKPLLYNGRKFDIRHFILISSINGNIKAYWYKEGYIRTSSQFFGLENLTDSFIHLTNDAIQQKSKNYGLYQPANKISYSQFQRYLDTIFPGRRVDFQNQILAKMREIVCNIMKANYKHIDSKKKQANFQLFGLDFMIDRQLKPWLIEVNQNPCLQTGCLLLSRLIPAVIENTFRLCVDPLLIPTNHFPAKQRGSLNDHYLKNLKFQIIFDELDYQKREDNRVDIFNLSTF